MSEPTFTAVRVDLDGSDTRRALVSPERIHAILERAYGPKEGRDPAGPRIQWRLDDDLLLTVGPCTPDRRTLAEQLDVTSFRSKPYRPVLDAVKTGTTWRFALDANPASHTDQGTHSPFNEPDALAWLDRQGMKHGFHVTRDRLDRPEATVALSQIRFRRKTGDVRFVASRFDGILAIDDPDKTRDVMLAGLGKSKAFGFGFLTLSRVDTWQE